MINQSKTYMKTSGTRYFPSTVRWYWGRWYQSTNVSSQQLAVALTLTITYWYHLATYILYITYVLRITQTTYIPTQIGYHLYICMVQVHRYSYMQYNRYKQFILSRCIVIVLINLIGRYTILIYIVICSMIGIYMYTNMNINYRIER